MIRPVRPLEAASKGFALTYTTRKPFAAVLNFMNESMRYLDGLDWVERYAWFGLFVSSILLLRSMGAIR
jgi:hypothetical protein